MPSRLWAFKWDVKTEIKNSSVTKRDFDSFTPSLVPPNTSQGFTTNQRLIDAINNSSYTINVARDFPWTYSPPGDVARAETPKIFLTEKRLKTNAFISSIVYSFGNTREGVSDIVNFLEKQGFGNFTNVLKQLKDNAIQAANIGTGAVANFLAPQGGISSFDENTAEAFRLRGQSIARELSEYFEDKALDTNTTLQTPLLQAYQNLYPSTNTGWKYVLPYFDDYYNSAQNIFGDDTNMNVLNMIKAGSDVFQDVASFAGALSRPFGFSFQEKAKFYNFPSEGEEFSFTFPLVNTGSTTFDEVVRNWQLIFLLLYQNKPSRINRNVIEPPVFYEVNIPGQKFYPFCYITGMSVDFKGSRRELNFNLDIQNTVQQETSINNADPNLVGPQQQAEIVRDLGSNVQSTKFRAIIPDAYVIKITMKSLVAETRNFMAYTVLGRSLDQVVAKVTDLDAVNSNATDSRLGQSAAQGSNINLNSGANTPVNYQSGTVDSNGTGRFFAA